MLRLPLVDVVMPPFGGMTALSTIDFPNHLSCVLYTQGCPLRCGYCQNHHLIPLVSQETQVLDEEAIWRFIERRKGLLEAVVISGGEPTIHVGLGHLLRRLKEQGFKTGLHTAGVNPERLKSLMPLLDWVGLDVKATAKQYQQITGRRGLYEKNRQALRILQASGVAYECRTTVNWHQLTSTDLLTLGMQLAAEKVSHYAVQISHTQQCLDQELQRPYPTDLIEITRVKEMLSGFFPHFEWRT